MLQRETIFVHDTLHNRQIRSFVTRQARRSKAMAQNIQELWPIYGLDLRAPLRPEVVFGRQAPLTVEIGFGNGDALLALAHAHPERDFIGVEVYQIGIAQLLGGIKQHQLTNVRIYCADAVEVLTHCIANSCLQAVHLFFPDPWPKVRHHKRRLVQVNFVQLVQAKLVPHGILHMATDWEDYAQHMSNVMQRAVGWEQKIADPDYIKQNRIQTKFAQRGQQLGHGTWDLIFRKLAPSNILLK